jgi:hypothetical protein
MNYKVRIFWTIWAIGFYKRPWVSEWQVFIGPVVFTAWR